MIKDPRVAVAFAVKRGQLIKPETCSICGSRENIEGHHEDYSKPLEVTWLCRKCHIELHKSRKTFNANNKSNNVTFKRGRIHFYPDDELRQQVQDAANKSKLSVSSWLKLAAVEKLERDEHQQRRDEEGNTNVEK